MTHALYGRLAVSEGLPGWGVRILDYLGLGLILLATEQLWQHPRLWPSWGGAFVGGVACLWLGDAVPITWKRLQERWEAPKALAIALAECETLRQKLHEEQRVDKKENNELKQQIAQLRKESLSLEVGSRLVAGPAAFEEQRKIEGLLSSIQIEALTIAKELRDFLANMPPFPSDPVQNAGEDNLDFLDRLMDMRNRQEPWKAKLGHGYANRRFGERITSLMHRAGEEEDYPAYVPYYAEKLPLSADDIRKLAQDMEGVAIWVNRKEDGEANPRK